MATTSRIPTSLLTASGLLLATLSLAQSEIKKESAATRVALKSTARIHSSGMFSYGGRIACTNPVADINLVLERNGWGIMCFKAIDLSKSSSSYSFMMSGVYKNVKLGKHLTITPQITALLEQEHTVADKGSDIGFITLTSWKPDTHWTIDHTMLIGNLLIDPADRDWVNRVRVMYTKDHFDLTATIWHNNNVFDQWEYTSGSFSVAYARVKLSKQINLAVSATELGLVTSSDEVKYPHHRRFVISTSIQFTRS